MHIKAAARKLAHNSVNIIHIAANNLQRLLQRVCQIAQLILLFVIKLQLQLALQQRFALLCNMQNRFNHTAQNINHQAQQTQKRQNATHNRGYHHCGDNAGQLGCACFAKLLTTSNHLVQHAHQGSQIGLNCILIEALCS